MAERKTGPVKPPVLDLKARKTTARKAAGAKSAASKSAAPSQANAQTSSEAKTSQTTAAPPPKSAFQTSQDGFSPFLAALTGIIGGAIMGVILTFILLFSGLLQSFLPQTTDPQLQGLTNRVNINAEQITETLVGFNVLDDQIVTLRQNIDQQDNDLRSDIQGQMDTLALTQSSLADQLALLIDAQDQSQPVPQVVFDSTSLEADIAALNTRLNAIAAGASTDDAQNFARDLSQTRTAIDALSASLASLDTRIADNANSLSEMQNELRAQTNSTEANPPSQIIGETTQQITLALMGMQNALEKGRPFDIELQALVEAFPALIPTPDLIEIAPGGLLQPEQIISEFNSALPDILSAKPIDPDASWQENFWQRIKSLLALRSTSLTEGDPVENLVAQIEAALNRQDFISARHLINLLPPPMFAALGDISEQVSVMGNATHFLNQARARVLLTSQNNSELADIAQ